MPYQEKFSELIAHEGDLNPTKEKYPMMAAEIGITAASLSGVASTIRAAYDLRKKLEVKLRLRASLRNQILTRRLVRGKHEHPPRSFNHSLTKLEEVGLT